MPRSWTAGGTDRVVQYSPGVDVRTVRAGVLLPPGDVLGGAAAAVRSVLEAHAASVNRDGGVHGRSLDLAFDDAGGSAPERAASARALLDRERLFVLGASYVDGADSEIATLADELQVPLIATTGSPAVSASRYARAILAGAAEVARTLVAFAARHLGAERRVAIAHDRKCPAAREAALNEARRAAFAVTDDADLSNFDAMLDTLRTRRCDTVIFLAGAELLERFLGWALAHEWLPDLLLPAASAPPESLASIAMAAWIALPTGPFDRTPRGLADYRALQAFAPLRPDFPTLQFASLAAAEMLVEALRRAGRELTRERFLDAIDSITAFETGLVPSLSYSPTRRIGSTGAWIAPVKGGREIVWVEP
ncbi:MAG TPA: ABC transporter substrate-binding protein [Thermoanaerobaculia bacterium]|nr:ABC transporter substrate-binding protein [Thermoanaerobaculia bacterium]